MVPAWVVVAIMAVLGLGLLGLVTYFALRLSFVDFEIALKCRNPFSAIKYSFKMTKTNERLVLYTCFWRVIIGEMIPFTISALSSWISMSSVSAMSVVSAVLSSVGTIAVPVGLAIGTVLFIKCEEDSGDAGRELKFVEFFEERGAL